MSTVVLGVILLAVLGAWLYRERENAKERATLADRIMAPEVFQMAAMERAISAPPTATEPDPYTEPVLPERHDDLTIETLLEGPR